MNDFAIHTMLRNISAKMDSVTKNADSLDKSDEKIKTAVDYFNQSHIALKKTSEEFKESLVNATVATQEIPLIIKEFKETTNSFKKLVRFGWALIGAIAIGAVISAKAHAFDYVQVINSTNTPVNIQGSVTGSFTATASTSTVPIGFVSGTSTLTVSGANPLPVSGSFSFNPPALTTVTYNGTPQPVDVTSGTVGASALFTPTNPGFISPANNLFGSSNAGYVQFNTPQNVDVNNFPTTQTVNFNTNAVGGSTTAVVNAVGTTLATTISGQVTIQPVGVTTVTFNGFAQPTTSTSTYVVNIVTVTHNGFGQPVTSTSTYIINAPTVTFNGVTQPIYITNTATVTFNGLGMPTTSTSTYVVNIVTVTHNGFGQPVTSTSTYIINIPTVTFNSFGQPTTSTSTYIINAPTTTFNGVGQPVTSTSTNITATTTGGATPFTFISTAGTVGYGTNIKSSAGTLYDFCCTNSSATIAFVKVYNLGTAPAIGSSTIVYELGIPANSITGAGICTPSNDIGAAYGTGIAFAITGAVPIADTTAVSNNQVVCSGRYK